MTPRENESSFYRRQERRKSGGHDHLLDLYNLAAHELFNQEFYVDFDE